MRSQACSGMLALLALWAVSGCGAGSNDRPVVGAALFRGHDSINRAGPTNRYPLDGTWLFRLDRGDRGVSGRWFDSAQKAGWRRVKVPYAWNAGDNSVSSMIGAPAWYRRDFRVPDPRPGITWLVRFESVNQRASIWLNGRLIGKHSGAYLPFEFRLRDLRPGLNRLVVRTDNRRRPTDFPPAGGSIATRRPRAGWWNYGGILRQVFLRPVDVVDLKTVRVTPILPCPTCAATVQFDIRVHSYGRRPVAVDVRGRYGAVPVRFPVTTVPPGGTRYERAQVRLAHPRLWSPAHPRLYRVALDGFVNSVGGTPRAIARYTLMSGVRSIRVRGGRLLLNGAPTAFCGFGLHEDSLKRGAALTHADMRALIGRVRAAGATAIRAHYPLDPYMYELADRYGLLVWAEVPVYHTRAQLLIRPSVRRAALGLIRKEITVNGNHPSIFTWSVGNEFGNGRTAGERTYIRQAAAAIHALDPTRPAAVAFAARDWAPCTSVYRPLQLLGANDYFGWYAGHLSDLSPNLDKLRACYRKKAVVVSEFGAEANRSGPATEKGTYGFQRRFVRAYLHVFASKRWLSGAIYWTIQAFRVSPRWAGGNPHPTPPWHEKGLVSETGFVKPAFHAVSKAFHATRQYLTP